MLQEVIKFSYHTRLLRAERGRHKFLSRGFIIKTLRKSQAVKYNFRKQLDVYFSYFYLYNILEPGGQCPLDKVDFGLFLKKNCPKFLVA